MVVVVDKENRCCNAFTLVPFVKIAVPELIDVNKELSGRVAEVALTHELTEDSPTVGIK